MSGTGRKRSKRTPGATQKPAIAPRKTPHGEGSAMLKRLILALTLPVSGCASSPEKVQPPPLPPSAKVICEEIAADRAAHAAALAETQDERVLMTGDPLLTKLKAGCAG